MRKNKYQVLSIKYKVLCFLFLTLCIISKASAQDTADISKIYMHENNVVLKKIDKPQMIMQGFYQGVNMYIENPFTNKNSGFCVIKCLVNGNAIDSFYHSAFEIPLMSMGFKEGDSLKIEIWHHDDCKPKVIYNPPAPKKPVYFSDVTVDTAYILHFKTKGEAYKYTYIIEQYRWNKWVKIGEVEGKGIYGGADYSFQVIPHSGENMVRVKLLSPSNVPTVSKAVKFMSHNMGADYIDKCFPTELKFTAETMYEVYDSSGNIVQKGFGDKIEIKGLKPGVYYMNYDNKTMEFIIKK